VTADLRRIRTQISKEIEQARKAGRLRQYFAQMEARARRWWGEQAFSARPNGKVRRRRT
jgi:hypothetical protein